MKASMRFRLRKALQSRQDAIADSWCQVIAPRRHTLPDGDRLRQRLGKLTEQITALLFAEPFEQGTAREIGADLADLCNLEPESLGNTQRILAQQLVEGLSAEETTALQSRLGLFLEAVATGFCWRSREIFLAELQSAQSALQDARRQLDPGVEQRTAELQRTNEELRDEIAARQRTEQALRKSEQKYRDLVDGIEDLLLTVDLEGNILFANPSAERFTGYRPQETVGHALSEYVHPDDVQGLVEGIQQVLSGEPLETITGTGRDFEYRMLGRDGEVICVSTRGQPIRDGQGDIRGFRGISRDITERKRIQRALRESEQKFRTLADQSPNMIFISQRGRVVYASRQADRMMGYAQEEVLSGAFDFLTLLAPEHRELALSNFHRHMEGQEVRPAEYTLITRDGKRIEALIATRLIEYGGEPAILGVATDITERSRAERALRESEQTARALLKAPTDSVLLVDRRGQIIDLNETAASKLGMPIEELVGADVYGLFPADIAAQRRMHSQKVIDSGRPVRFEETRAGMWFDTVLYPVFDASGDVIKLAVVARESTERKHMEQALQESEARWRSLVENAPDPVLTVDHDGRILFINHPILGQDAAEAVGRNALDYLLPEQREKMRESIRRVFQAGQRDSLEVQARGQSDPSAWYGIRMGPVMRDGEVVAAMVMARDITERKKIEATKDNVIRDVSHELRTPLAKMLMSLELLLELTERDLIDRDRLARTGKVIHSSTQRLLHTLESILDLSALENGRAAYQMGTLRPAELVDEVLLDMRPLIKAKGLELAVNVPTILPRVAGDREKLFRVLANLIDNAVKFSEQGKVVISARCDNRTVELAVSDSGSGIQQQHLERVFERFFQEKSRFPGIGVGLTICRTIIAAHGGRIWAESSGRGLGTTIRFTLPVAEVSGRADHARMDSDRRG
jgi:PAS domain S-box-containing protein